MLGLIVLKMHVKWHILAAEAKDSEGFWSRHYSESQPILISYYRKHFLKNAFLMNLSANFV